MGRWREEEVQTRSGTKNRMDGVQASLSTRAAVFWASVPFFTAAVLATCVAVYVGSLLIGYDSFQHVCQSPSAIVHGRVYTAFTSVIFHGGFLHLVFNMLAFVPMGGSLERQLGSVRYAYLLLLFAVTNSLLATLMAWAAASFPLALYPNLVFECSIGFSGVIFALIVVETYTSGVQNRSIFGFFTVQAKWYPWVLLAVFQLLMPAVSLLGHLSGILSGLAYTCGLLSFLMPSSVVFNNIESSSFLAPLTRRPSFIVGGSTVSGTLPTVSDIGRASRGAAETLQNAWRSVQRLVPRQDSSTTQTPARPAETKTDPRFPGQGRVLGGSAGPAPPAPAARSVDTRHAAHEQARSSAGPLGGKAEVPVAPIVSSAPVVSADNGALSQLVAMGFDKATATAALNAAGGDLNLALNQIIA